MVRRIAIILPGLAPNEVVFGSRLFRGWIGDAEVRRLVPQRSAGELFGIRHGTVDTSEGVLTIAALGADPPPRSTHFAAKILTLDSGTVWDHGATPSPAEHAQIVAALPKLNTKSLTFVAGEPDRHGLVWEQRGDLAVRSPDEAHGRPYREVVPEGDGERALRMLIDDSANLLGEMEFNARREDEGKPALNMLWPWGPGVRGEFPNLAIKRGAPLPVATESLTLAGLSRLVGYRPLDRDSLGRGMPFRFESLPRDGDLLAILDSPAEFARRDQWDELDWWLAELRQRFLEPVLDGRSESPLHLLIVLPNAGDGVAVVYDSDRPAVSRLPFDSRVFEEPSSAYGISDLIASHLVG